MSQSTKTIPIPDTGSGRTPSLPGTRLGREILGKADTALEREWLVSNGIGGYAGASLAGANTRRYHGLLVAALQPPLGRTVLLGKLDEQVQLGGHTYNLAVNEWRGGAASLEGLDYLESFELEGNLPTVTYQIGEATLSKTTWMEYGLNTVYVRYIYEGPAGAGPLDLVVKPLVNCRDYHGSTHGSPEWRYNVEPETSHPQTLKIQACEGATSWWLSGLDQPADFNLTEANGWYWGFHYRQEQARGLEADEDMYCPATITTRLQPGQSFTLAASTAAPETVLQLYPASKERELNRQAALLAKVDLTSTLPELETLAGRLVLAADQFIAGRPDWARPGQLMPDYRTILAGYHWFGDWGRDTMISLPGLAIVTGRYQEAATILRSFAHFVSRGMLPNRFPDNPGDPEALSEGEYNTVDATLWYFDALAKYLEATGDWDLVKELFPVLTGIIDWHIRGTRFNIKVDEDGLLAEGAEGVQLTWMDAKVGDWVVTPRRGKPVEINALWYRACRVIESFSQRLGTGEQTNVYRALADRIASNFERIYWFEAGGYFYDLINEFGQPDPALRPNQVIALALAPELVSPGRARLALEQVSKNLLTPVGLRSLSPQDPAYRPAYGGDQFSRDSAYYQGTIWTWLLGPFVQAMSNFKSSEDTNSFLQPFVQQINEAAVGQVNEIFGASWPFPPVGCVAQAWSVAQLLEIWQLEKQTLPKDNRGWRTT